MSKKKASMYWRICWTLVIPFSLIGVFIYTVIVMTPLTYGDVEFPPSAHAAGWTLTAFGVSQIPIWMLVALLNRRKSSSKDVSR